MGRDQVLKVKADQWADLCGHYDDAQYPVHIFVWDSYRKRSALVPLTKLRDVLNDGKCSFGHFAEGNRAWIGWPATEVFG